ncbi:MAG: nitrilase-related carbon-nitrogen hydrolase [Dehalococcoidia bacterium]|nr:nitrilase-related carbon-nitrogen hydrolase [Dehalococcoidia bacterium]
MSTMTVAAIQLGPRIPSDTATTERIVQLVQQAGTRGIRLAALPELALTPYFAAQLHHDPAIYADPLDVHEAFQRISEAARDAGVALSVPAGRADNGRLFNSMRFVDVDEASPAPTARCISRARKSQRRMAASTVLEEALFRASATWASLSPPSPACRSRGLMLLRADALRRSRSRSLALQGAEVVLVGCSTPVTPTRPGASLARGRRASELAMRGGACFDGLRRLIAAGKAGVENGLRYIGGSCVIAPDGEILARARTQRDEIVHAELDLDRIAELRERWNFERNRRPDAYVLAAPGAVPAGVSSEGGDHARIVRIHLRETSSAGPVLSA